MKKFSPNLKPKTLHTHVDRAHRLGVPRTNVVDLRSLSSTDTMPVADTPPIQQAQSITELPARLQTRQAMQTELPAPVRISWMTRWRERRRLTKQAKQLATQRLKIKRNVPEAAPVPETAQLHTHDTAQTEAQEITKVLQQLNTPVTVPTDTLLNSEPVADTKQRAYKSKSTRSISWVQAIRPLAAFVVISSILIAPFASLAFYKRVSSIKGEVLDVSQAAATNLAQGGQQVTDLDFTAAQSSFNDASVGFKEAEDQLQGVNATLTPLVKYIPEAGQQYTSAENVLVAGENIASAAEDVAQAFTVLSNLKADNLLDATSESSNIGITDLLVLAHAQLRPAVPRLERAALALQDVQVDSFPEEYRNNLTQAKEVVPVVARSLKQLLLLSENLLTILGHNQSKRYLVVFSNNAEIRGCMGFIGSFAVADIRKGKVNNIEIPGGGPYDLLGNLDAKVISPQPLHYVNPYFQMQDANWWPDCPTSAQKVQWFYTHSGESSADGVIFLTPAVITKMLEITGPISMSEYAGTIDENPDTPANTDTIGQFLVDDNYEITADNFYRITQAQAERKFDDTPESKKFIADLTPKLLDKLFSLESKNFLPVLQVLYTSLSEKDLLMYFNDPFLQNEMSRLGWTGEIKSTSKDYLMVVDTNIAGGKTDRVIDETIEHQADIQSDGRIIDTVTITRIHNGKSDDEFEKIKNMDYLRVYVPQGSTLLSAEGFEQPDPKLRLDPERGYEPDPDVVAISGDVLIDEATQTRINNEFGKTVFGNWVQTEAGETSKVTFRYELPFTIQLDQLLHPADSYSLLIQKQAGAFDPLVLSNIHYPKEYTVRWSYPTEGNIHTVLKKDAYLGLVFER